MTCEAIPALLTSNPPDPSSKVYEEGNGMMMAFISLGMIADLNQRLEKINCDSKEAHFKLALKSCVIDMIGTYCKEPWKISDQLDDLIKNGGLSIDLKNWLQEISDCGRRDNIPAMINAANRMGISGSCELWNLDNQKINLKTQKDQIMNCAKFLNDETKSK